MILRLKQLMYRLLPRRRGQRAAWICFGLFFVGGIFLFLSPVSASLAEPLGDLTTAIFDGLLRFFTKTFLYLSRLCIGLTIFALRYFIELAAYNNYIDVPTVKFGWLLVRDVANMFFVVALLVIAFGTILGLDQYEWKKSLVGFIFAAILINFSNLIAGIIIDAAHVFTMTFLNAMTATAGGNIISMLHLDQIYSFVHTAPAYDTTGDFAMDIWAASVLAFVFSITALWAVGAYLVILAARVVVLWMLIIVSPLAYLFSMIPQTKGYASQWWEKFLKHVFVLPIMVFFLWLAFATLGSGKTVQDDLGINFQDNLVILQTGDQVKPQSAALNEIATWENMAEFILAFMFLLVGLKFVQETGTVGSGLTQGVQNFAKKAIVIASGIGLAKALGGKVWNEGKEMGQDYAKLASGKLGFSKIPFFGSQSAGKIKRKAALHKMEDYYKDREREIGAKGGVMTNWARPNVETAAEQTLSADIAERYKKGKMEKAKGQAEINQVKDEEKVYQKKLNKFKTKHIKKHGVAPEQHELAGMMQEAAHGLPLLEMLVKEQFAKQKTGKGKSEEERLGAELGDALRWEEGKQSQNLIEHQNSQYRSDMDKMAKKKYDEVMALMAKNFAMIREIEAIPEKKRTQQEGQLLKNAIQDNARAVANAEERGWGEFLNSTLVSLDSSFAGIDFNDARFNHIRDMALIGGGTRSDFEDDHGEIDTGVSADARAKQYRVQEKIRKGMKEKAPEIIRGLMDAKDKAANDYGEIESNHQLRTGKNARGDTEIGWSNLMEAGTLGSENGMVTGEARNGRQRREVKTNDLFKNRSLREISGNSLVSANVTPVTIRGNQVYRAEDYNPEMEAKILELANLTASEIKAMKLDAIRRITGGDRERSTWNGTAFELSGAMRPKFERIFQGFHAKFRAQGADHIGQQRVSEAIQAFLTQAGVDPANAGRITNEVCTRGTTTFIT